MGTWNLIEMELGEPDASSRRRPMPVEGSEFVMDVDGVIMALEHRQLRLSPPLPKAKTNRYGCIEVDETR